MGFGAKFFYRLKKNYLKCFQDFRYYFFEEGVDNPPTPFPFILLRGDGFFNLSNSTGVFRTIKFKISGSCQTV